MTTPCDYPQTILSINFTLNIIRTPLCCVLTYVVAKCPADMLQHRFAVLSQETKDAPFQASLRVHLIFPVQALHACCSIFKTLGSLSLVLYGSRRLGSVVEEDAVDSGNFRDDPLYKMVD